MKTMTAMRNALAMLCVALIASFALAGTAFAATVHGADYHGSGSALESGEIDVLEVDGKAGETVFLDVKFRGSEIAKNLPYTIGKDAAAGDESTWAGAATLDISNLDLSALDGKYIVEAYADRAGNELLYRGAIYGVYADLPDGTSKLIGTRTVDASESAARTFVPSETLYVNGHTYRLTGEAQGTDVQHFAYTEYDEATTVDGVIKYLDGSGKVVASTKIPGLAYGEKRTVNVPSLVTAENGDIYRTVFFRDSLTAENPGHTSFSMYATKMSEADQALAGFYVATIQMVDEQGLVIATDSVDVTGDFVYTAPSTIYKTEAVAGTGESRVVTYKVNQSPVVRLSAANDGVLNRTRTIRVGYKAEPLDAADVNVTFILCDGEKKVSAQVIESYPATVNADNPVATPPTEIEKDGTKYYLAGDPQDYAYEYKSGEVPVVKVYYLPEGFPVPGAYEVTVNYVNFLTGDVIESHSYTSDPDQNSRITIDSPEAFSANGVDYMRLDGQDAEIRHSYYAAAIREYVVYYRDVNDTLTSGAVVNTIRVVYDGTTTIDGGVVGDGTTAAAGAAGAATDAAAVGGDAGQALQLNEGQTYNVFDGADNNATLTNESGVNSNTERIEDSETPLASGFDRGATSSAATSFASIGQMAVPAVIAGVVAIIAIVAIVIIRRRANNDPYEA